MRFRVGRERRMSGNNLEQTRISLGRQRAAEGEALSSQRIT